MLSRPLLAVAVVAGGPGPPTADDRAPKRPAGIEVKDARGQMTAQVVPGRPCRAEIDGVELQVGAEPLVAMVGAVRWTGEDHPTSGTLLSRDGTLMARIATPDPTTLELFDSEGITMIRAHVDGQAASVVNRAGAIVRTAKRAGKAITVGDLTVTGTDDLLLAAVLSAPEAVPEVRALAACHRLFPPQKATL